MLVLGRKENEQLLLEVAGYKITITINEIRCKKGRLVKVGIEAPREVVVVRPEVLEREAMK